jgi:hypothetical protein
MPSENTAHVGATKAKPLAVSITLAALLFVDAVSIED